MTLKFEECAGLVKRGRNGQKKLENNTKTRVSFFDGIEGFMQQTRNR